MTSNRAVIAATVALAASILAGTAGAQDQRHDDHKKDDQRKAEQPQDPRYPQQGNQQARIDQERKRQADYQRALDERVRAAQAQQAQLQAQNRAAQLAQHQQYQANLEAQRRALQTQRNYATEPYFTTAPAYRYHYGSVVRETNQYGADVLRQAVNNGYPAGLPGGRADRAGSSSVKLPWGLWLPGRQSSATAGRYVDQSDYNYYFREGFRRGYEDGFAQTPRYGQYTNGNAVILGNVLTSILGLVNLH